MFVLDVAEDLPDLEPDVALRVGALHLPAPAPALMLQHVVLDVQHLAAIMVILAVDLQLVVPDHLLYLHVPMGRIGIETISLRTFLPFFFLLSSWQRLELVEAVLANLVTVLAREELELCWDCEAEWTLDHGPDGARFHICCL